MAHSTTPKLPPPPLSNINILDQKLDTMRAESRKLKIESFLMHRIVEEQKLQNKYLAEINDAKQFLAKYNT